MEYKGHYQFQAVSPLKVRNAVEHLIQNHSEYKDDVLQENESSYDICNEDHANDTANTDSTAEMDLTNVLREPQVQKENVLTVESEVKCENIFESQPEVVTEHMILTEPEQESENIIVTESEVENEKEIVRASEIHDKNRDQTPNTDGLTDNELTIQRESLLLDTCLQPVNIAQEILAFGDDVFCIASAEGNKPKSLF